MQPYFASTMFPCFWWMFKIVLLIGDCVHACGVNGFNLW